LQSWKVVVEYLIHFRSEASVLLLKKFEMSEGLCRCLSQVYSNFSTGNGGHCLNLSEEDENAMEINEMKKAALELQYLILSHNVSHSAGSSLYAFTGNQIYFYINTLCFLSLQRQLIERFDLEELSIAMIRILRCMSEDSPGILVKSWKEMLHFIVFPFMEISEAELNDFEECTGNYIEVTEDCCEKQRMGILKTEAASFLEKMSDMSQDIAGACPGAEEGSSEDDLGGPAKQSTITKYIINFAIASIKHNLNMQYIDNHFLEAEGLPKEVRPMPVETAFMVLSIFSYCLESYKCEL
jgi:hypothetical protein